MALRVGGSPSWRLIHCIVEPLVGGRMGTHQDDSVGDHHPTPTRGFTETVHWALKHAHFFTTLSRLGPAPPPMLASQHIKSLTAPYSPDRGALLVCRADHLAAWPVRWPLVVRFRSHTAVEQGHCAGWSAHVVAGKATPLQSLEMMQEAWYNQRYA